jgi:hypothetical protein
VAASLNGGIIYRYCPRICPGMTRLRTEDNQKGLRIASLDDMK